MTVAFNFHPELCVGCGRCVVTCLDANDIDPEVTPPYRVLLKKESVRGGKVKIVYYSAACMHCAEPACAAACPNGCYTKDAETGATLLDAENCVGCRKCAAACPYNAIRFADGRASKCTACLERLEAEQLPACVAVCARRAITSNERNRVLADGRAKLARDLKSAAPTG
ncbi:MAG: 4Fe-4S dicluster domain-containing protein [Oscillospiraceae bacterium]|nr:4Fe-4S dicluster domain-containing protein [Oscillospiraceae bacterium]